MRSFPAQRSVTISTFRARFTYLRYLTVCTMVFSIRYIPFHTLNHIILTTLKVKVYIFRYIVLFTFFGSEVAHMVFHDVHFARGAIPLSTCMVLLLSPVRPHHLVARGALPPFDAL